jgi:hypothetical protein
LQGIVVFVQTDNVTIPALIERHHDMLDPSQKTKEFILVQVVFNFDRFDSESLVRKLRLKC